MPPAVQPRTFVSVPPLAGDLHLCPVPGVLPVSPVPLASPQSSSGLQGFHVYMLGAGEFQEGLQEDLAAVGALPTSLLPRYLLPRGLGLWVGEQESWGLALSWLKMGQATEAPASRWQWWLGRLPECRGRAGSALLRPDKKWGHYLDFSSRCWTWKFESRADSPSLPFAYPWGFTWRISARCTGGRVTGRGRVDSGLPLRGRKAEGFRWRDRAGTSV